MDSQQVPSAVKVRSDEEEEEEEEEDTVINVHHRRYIYKVQPVHSDATTSETTISLLQNHLSMVLRETSNQDKHSNPIDHESNDNSNDISYDASFTMTTESNQNQLNDESTVNLIGGKTQHGALFGHASTNLHQIVEQNLLVTDQFTNNQSKNLKDLDTTTFLQNPVSALTFGLQEFIAEAAKTLVDISNHWAAPDNNKYKVVTGLTSDGQEIIAGLADSMTTSSSLILDQQNVKECADSLQLENNRHTVLSGLTLQGQEIIAGLAESMPTSSPILDQQNVKKCADSLQLENNSHKVVSGLTLQGQEIIAGLAKSMPTSSHLILDQQNVKECADSLQLENNRHKVVSGLTLQRQEIIAGLEIYSDSKHNAHQVVSGLTSQEHEIIAGLQLPKDAQQHQLGHIENSEHKVVSELISEGEEIISGFQKYLESSNAALHSENSELKVLSGISLKGEEVVAGLASLGYETCSNLEAASIKSDKPMQKQVAGLTIHRQEKIAGLMSASDDNNAVLPNDASILDKVCLCQVISGLDAANKPVIAGLAKCSRCAFTQPILAGLTVDGQQIIADYTDAI